MTLTEALARRLVRRAHTILRCPLPARAANDYATHVPVLIGLSQLITVRRVLEFGSGLYSTLTFLNRTAFPGLEVLDSFESDANWMRTVEEAATRDPRLRLHLIPEPMESALDKVSLPDYKLVFVDNSMQAASRASTIGVLAERCPAGCAVVIHDFEVELYRHAAGPFSGRFEYRQFNPCTAVAWQSFEGLRPGLAMVKKVLWQHKDEYAPDDISSWVSAFQRELRPCFARR